jgi:hypothetical protein
MSELVMAAVPLFGWLAGALVIYSRTSRWLTLRESFLVSTVLAAVWLVLGIEILSLAHAIRFWPILLWWLVPLAGLVGPLLRSRRSWPRWPRLRIFDYSLLAAVIFLLGWSFLQAIFSPPNNVDSQEYHLQRQVFWLQQGSVSHFPTSNLRQVAMPPLTEYAGLTLMVLSGGDRYHNLVQWLALLLSLFAVSLSTRRFNRSATAQLLACLWVATIPLALLQASTTKNDVVVLMGICLLTYWVLLLDKRSRLRWAHVGLIGSAFGAVMLAKGTGLIFALPLGALATYYLLRYHRSSALAALGLIALVALGLNLGHFVRNYRIFESVAPDRPGIHDGPPVGNGDHSAGALLSNMLRNAGSHAVTPSAAWNARLTALMRAIHEKLGRNIDDPATTWLPGGRFRPYEFSQDDEDKAAAPAHLLLILLLPVALGLARRSVPWRAAWPIAGVFLASFILFSLLLRWQAWHVRLIIAVPAVVAPLFAWSFGSARLRYAAPFAALLLVGTVLPSLNSKQRPLIGANSVFTADPLMLRCYYHPFRAKEYRDLVDHIEPRHPRVIGFFTPPGSPDYPMQRLLLDRVSPPPRFTAFNATLQIPGKPEPDPDVLLVVRSNLERMQHASTGTWYRRESRFGRFAVFVRDTD